MGTTKSVSVLWRFVICKSLEHGYPNWPGTLYALPYGRGPHMSHTSDGKFSQLQKRWNLSGFRSMTFATLHLLCSDTNLALQAQCENASCVDYASCFA